MSAPDPAVSPTRGARRKRETRRRLIDAGRSIISTDGVAGLRIRELADIADVGHGSFYNHFESMDDLVEAIVEESLQSLADAVIPTVPDDTDAAVVAAAAAVRSVKLADDDPAFARLMVNLDSVNGLFLRIMLPYVHIVLDRGIEAGRFRVTDRRVTAIMLVGGGLTLIRAVLDGSAPEGAATAHAEAVLVFLGLDPDEAARISRSPMVADIG